MNKSKNKNKNMKVKDNSMLTVPPTKMTRWLIWLGLIDNSFTQQKTVKFGDATAVNSGRFYSIVMVVGLLVLWILSSAYEWVEPFFWPPINDVGSRFMKLVNEGFRNIELWEHVSISIYRVISGVVYGSLVGIPLGLAMGLSSVMRGLFDPIVEFVRPIPPLALIPLVILWFGIDETAKIYLLFLASLFIMVIAARSGVSNVSVSKVHAAYMLGANKWQVLRYVIMPNALPEIFTGWRISMGICWGTVVAAELVAADRGLGSMIMIAKNFLQTDTVVIGIALIGMIGYTIELIMRALEKRLIPWKGKS